CGSGADAMDGVVQRAGGAIKASVPDLVVATDVCLCEYTDHGHCGIVAGGDVADDPTLQRLAATPLPHPRPGADGVGPPDIMEGRAGATGRALAPASWEGVAILA